jgi:hypothetical protein
MQFSDEVKWGAEDFAFAIALVGGAGLTFELAVRMTGNKAYLTGVGLSLAATFMLVWINLAVGIIGSEDDPANLMYFGVPAMALAGAIIARFRPAGMALAAVAAAIAQLGIAAVVLTGNLYPQEAGWPKEVVGLTGFFTMLWLVAAWCFDRANRASDLAQNEGASPKARP